MNDSLRILIVDDDDVDRLLIDRYLRKADLNVETVEAASADAAYRSILQESYNCIFLDYLLPDAEGVSLVKQFRAQGISTPIVMLTGQGDERVAVELMKAGASDYLVKSSLSPESLVRSLHNVIRVYEAEERIKSAQAQLEQTNALLKQQNQALQEQRHQIEQQNFQLSQANQLKSEFLAVVTHEIRTPLNAIMGFSQILRSQSKGPLNDHQAEMVNRIFTNGESLLYLVEDVLDMSTIEADRLELEPTYFDLHNLIQTTLSELKPLAEKKNLEIRSPKSISTLEVYNDRHRLRQILINLISNAIKFTTAGHISVEANLFDADTIEIVVEDTGIGIAPEKLSYIFQPFCQADQTTKRRYSGTGLGLTIAHSLVSMMAGTIQVESDVNQGSLFRIQLPRHIHHPGLKDFPEN